MGFMFSRVTTGREPGASTVNWVTQSAFVPPLVVMVVGVKADSGTSKTVKAAQTFALNMLGKDQKALCLLATRVDGPVHLRTHVLDAGIAWTSFGANWLCCQRVEIKKV
jgi:flavin reductase (DIM6/NTAB) family NADH-FMN oxidoreductase RutF